MVYLSSARGFWDLVIHHNGPVKNKLPPMAQHFDPYFDLQLLCLRTELSYAHNKNTEKLLQDYLTFIPNLGDFGSLDVSVLKAKFKDNIQPLITIAGNNGFEFI
jgi:hypothetical protein